MIKKVLLGAGALLVVVVAGIGVAAARQPDTFRIQRSVEIAAPPAEIYLLVDDFKKWNQWSPFEKMDPGMKKTYTGDPGKVGAGYAWSGNDHAGEGTMTLLEAEPPKRLKFALHFTRPMTADNTADFTFEPVGDKTRVTWGMDGANNAISKVMCVFMDLDAMVGKDFQAGLEAMKAIAEKP